MSTPVDNETKLKLTAAAVLYMLRRIAEDENVRYHVGFGTEAFSRLVVAHSAVTGTSQKEIERQILARNLPCSPKAIVVDEVRNVIDRCNPEHNFEKLEAFDKIATIVRS